MPFYGDPWRTEYFAAHPVAPHVRIPITDDWSWQFYPAHRWVYNKLLVAESQGLPHGPHGTEPPSYPVFSKPIYNLTGMGKGSCAIGSPAEYLERLTPGHMWMPLLEGRHVSSDAALVDGVPHWWRHTTGKPGPGGTFDYWTVHAAPDATLEAYLGAWVARHLQRFTGIVNFETIGGVIIECHLRMAEQWVDLNGAGWLEAVIGLYTEGRWRFDDRPREGYSVVLFGPNGRRWSYDMADVEPFRKRPSVSTVQITFQTEYAPEVHVNPPGGFRLAIVNCWDLAAGLAARADIARIFVADPPVVDEPAGDAPIAAFQRA